MQNNRDNYYPNRYKDSHHITPISLKGYDIPENIADILRTDHNLIHQTLDMNSRLFYNLSRIAKEKTNHKILMGPDDLQYRHDVQMVYFERLNRLPQHIKQLHLEKMNQLVVYESKRLEKLSKITIPTISNTFDAALSDYHTYGKELAAALQAIVKKGMR